MANVEVLPVATRYNLNPNLVLEAAIDKLDEVVLVGVDKNGEYYYASSVGSGPEVLWLLEKMKQELLDI